MSTEIFTRTNRDLYLAIIASVALLVLGYFERGFDRFSALAAVVFTLGVLFVYYSTKNTYLKIRDKRNLINRGYKSFGKDELDIYDIKYIYRVPAFPWKSWGSLMVMYIKDSNEPLRHSALRETIYSDDVLKQLLTRLKQINPSIELDQEYQDFLAGELGADKRKSFTNTWTKNTKKSVEERLRAKGEAW